MAEGIEFVDKTVRRNLERIVKAAPEIEAKAVREASKPVFALSQKLVPLDTGALRASGKIATAAKGDTITSFISYGDPSAAMKAGQVELSGPAAYAQAVHEHPSSHSPRSWKGKVRFQQRSSPRSFGGTKGPWWTPRKGGIGKRNITRRGPKFLERAINNSRGSFNREVGQEIMRQLKGA